MRRAVLLSLTALLFLASAAVVWSGLNLPPVRFLVRYGLTPGCRPTGKVVKAEGVEFVLIGPGIFRMGSDYDADRGDVRGRICDAVGVGWGSAPKPSDEMPLHWIEFRHGFGIARTEVTKAEYGRFDPKHAKSLFWKSDRGPMTDVNWEEARKYCTWLTGKLHRKVRLPSEAEWECACRAGTRTEFPFGTEASRLGEYAWYSENSSDRTHEVGGKRSNAWGLSDMEGNVWEWCEDRWHASYLLMRKVRERDGSVVTETTDRAPDNGSAWERGGTSDRVYRGGSWICGAEALRCASRIAYVPSFRSSGLGFRPACH